MKAYFRTSISVVKQAMDSEAKASNLGIRTKAKVLDDGLVMVEGEPQPVMSLIGEVAGYGEDGLLFVGRYTNQDLNETVNCMVDQILSDMASGLVPKFVSSFSQLHDYVDANCYGGFCDDVVEDYDEDMETHVAFMNAAQSVVNLWLKTRRSS